MALFRYQRHPSPRRRSRPPQSCREGPKAFQDCGHPSNSTSHILPEPSRAKSTSSPRASLLAPLDLWTPLLLPSLVSSTALFHVAGDQHYALDAATRTLPRYPHCSYYPHCSDALPSPPTPSVALPARQLSSRRFPNPTRHRTTVGPSHPLLSLLPSPPHPPLTLCLLPWFCLAESLSQARLTRA
ncbi:hypothetical protein BS50DRAFT_576167 [Corynespora cassiicola Philippines]|uniref:Uncharacterized protein n=1 Tax=Corynespora cassiicola Philippines TaxID=1448308 RepID=A0A2T2NH84_CORCC|nr:hypothetical protein BS50DRAFT_576167 [Corynespora cassiicola Philippines]